jgi:hypothetical protein
MSADEYPVILIEPQSPEYLVLVRGERGDPGTPASAIDNLITQLAHGFSVGSVLCFNATTSQFELALNDSVDRLGRYLVKYVPTVDTFSLARSGDLVKTGLVFVPGAWYHASGVTPGALVEVSVNDAKPSSGMFANPIGQAVGIHDLIYFTFLPYSV